MTSAMFPSSWLMSKAPLIEPSDPLRPGHGVTLGRMDGAASARPKTGGWMDEKALGCWVVAIQCIKGGSKVDSFYTYSSSMRFQTC